MDVSNPEDERVFADTDADVMNTDDLQTADDTLRTGNVQSNTQNIDNTSHSNHMGNSSSNVSSSTSSTWREASWEEEDWLEKSFAVASPNSAMGSHSMANSIISASSSEVTHSEQKGVTKLHSRYAIQCTLLIIFGLLAVGWYYGWTSFQTEFDRILFGKPWNFSWNRLETMDETPRPIRDSEIRSLAQATELGRVNVVRNMLREGVSASQKDENGNTPLHLAALRGNVEMMKILLAAGADPNATNTIGNVPLLNAVSNQQSEEVVSLLLKHGAKVPKTYAFTGGNTLLHFAARYGNSTTCELLLDAGADIHAKNIQGETALFFSIDSCDTKTMQFLIDRGAKVQTRDNLGRTPLYRAAGVGDLSMVGTLIAAGAELNAVDRDGNTPLHAATLQRHDEVIALLITAGADVTIKNRQRMEPIQVIPWDLSQEMRVAIRQAFLDAGATATEPPVNPWVKMMQENKNNSARNTEPTWSFNPPPRL